MDAKLKECLTHCLSCYQVCIEAVRHCLEQGGRHAEAEHVVTLLDCAEICRTSADLMLRSSAVHAHTCRACAEICQRCAESCSALGDDAEMMRCADECRRCAESCREMASHA